MGLSLLLLLGGKLNLFAQYASGGSPLSLSLVERTQSLRSLRHDDTLHLDAPSKATLSESLQKDKQRTSPPLSPHRLDLVKGNGRRRPMASIYID